MDNDDVPSYIKHLPTTLEIKLFQLLIYATVIALIKYIYVKLFGSSNYAVYIGYVLGYISVKLLLKFWMAI